MSEVKSIQILKYSGEPDDYDGWSEEHVFGRRVVVFAMIFQVVLIFICDDISGCNESVET